MNNRGKPSPYQSSSYSGAPQAGNPSYTEAWALIEEGYDGSFGGVWGSNDKGASFEYIWAGDVVEINPDHSFFPVGSLYTRGLRVSPGKVFRSRIRLCPGAHSAHGDA